MIKYISFDLDGTLADETFDKIIWNEEIPKLYAEKHHISLKEAENVVFADYYRALYIENAKDWTDIDMWFKRLNLSDYKTLVDNLKHHIFVFADSKQILEYLSQKYKLIVVSNAEEKFLNLKLEAEGLNTYFDKICSATTHFGVSRKSKEVFQKVIEELNISPDEIIHIGDDHHLDYEVPMSVGIKAYHLVRSKDMRDEHTIHTLLDLKKLL